MKLRKKKNGFIIIVKDFDNVITILNEKTKEIIKETKCQDHIKAILIAKKLLAD